MVENKNEELQNQTLAENLQKDKEENLGNQENAEVQEEEQKPSSNARFILWTLAGIYLLYTGYSLCKGYITGAEGTSMGFMLAGIAFAVIGVGLLFASIKSMISEDKIKKAKAAKDAAVAAAAGGELQNENQSETKKSMSIAERANLAKRLEDEEEDAKE